MGMPTLLRSIVNSFIPADKKEKVQFLGSDRTEPVQELFELHQVEEKYGGTARNLAQHETYPYKFFPNCRGAKSSADFDETSLHQHTVRAFHEGTLWDESWDEAKQDWIGKLPLQSLTTKAAAEAQRFGTQAQACKDLATW